MVSIHASAREATSTGAGSELLGGSFNPRLRAGGDTVCAEAGQPPRRFNPRLRAGGDRGCLLKSKSMPRVSIHASAREATPAASMTPQGEQFQSTPPRGRRHSASPSACRRSCFNPRLRAGGDLKARQGTAAKVGCFNPRLRAGGDPRRLRRRRRGPGFNPRLRAGGDGSPVAIGDNASSCFNPRLRAGGDAT